MINFVNLAIFAVLVVFCGATTVSQCPGKPLPNAVRVSGCSSQPCQIVRGSTIYVEIDFTVSSSTTSLSAGIVYTIFGLSFPYTLPGNAGNVCMNLKNGVTCPLAAQQSATYVISLATDPSYPAVSGSVQITITNQSNAVVACFSLQIALV